MKQKLKLLLLGMAFIPGLLLAQNTTGSEAFTLKQCIDYALTNSTAIKNAVADEQIAKAKVGEVRATGLPQITGSVQLVNNTQLSRFFSKADTNSPLIPQTAKAALGPYQGQTLAQANFFQLKNSGDAKVSISQLIFNGSYLVGLQASKTYKELSSKSTEQTIQAIESVTKAFYMVLINNERMKIFDANIERLNSLYSNTSAMHQNGFVEKIDVSRIKVALNNLVTERDKFKNLQDLSLELLKFQMNYPMDKGIAISGNIQDIKLDTASISAQKLDYNNRIEYSLLETNRQLQKLSLKNNYISYLPTIAAFGNFGYSTQSPTFGGLFKTETKGFQESPQAGPDKWYSYGMIGLTMSVPIFDGFTKMYQAQQSKLNYVKAENNVSQFKNAVDLQVSQSNITLRNSIKTLNAQNENLVLATEVADVTKVKYNEGVGSNIEVTQAETSLREAQTNYYNALYDAIIAKIDLQKALGTLKPE